MKRRRKCRPRAMTPEARFRELLRELREIFRLPPPRGTA